MSKLRSHRAAVLSAPGQMRIAELALPTPAVDEVRVRLEGCGICASNLAVWEGRPWVQYPRPAGSPGHEGWGVIDAVGREVRDLFPGQRVALISRNAYAEYDVAPGSAVVKLATELDELPFPGEALARAMNVFERSEVRSGHRVAIVGAGFLGLLLTQLAVRAGAEVTVLSRRQFALGLAREMGACTTIASNEPCAAARCAQRLSPRGYDRAIETAGLQVTLDLASKLTAERGRLIIAGYHQSGLRQVDMRQWNWRGLDVANAHERSTPRYVSGMEQAVRAVLDGRLNPFPLLTHQVVLDALDTGFSLTRARPEGFIKAVVLLQESA